MNDLLRFFEDKKNMIHKTQKIDSPWMLDLRRSNPKIIEASLNRVARIDSELLDYDLRLFKDFDSASDFLARYNEAKKKLIPIAQRKNEPSILYKRRYMIQSAMGLKLQTFRKYRKNWEPGQIFGLHDQVFFIRARLTKLIDHGDSFEYKFEVLT